MGRGPWLTRAPLAALVAALVVSAGVAIAAVARGDLNDTDGKVLATAGMLAGASAMALPGLNHFAQGRYRWLAGPAVGASAATCVAVVAIIWAGDLFDENTAAKSAGTLAVAAFFANHILLLLFARSRHVAVRGCMAGTIAVIVALGMLLIAGIWTEPQASAFGRVAAALGILDVLGSLLVPLLGRLAAWEAGRRTP